MKKFNIYVFTKHLCTLLFVYSACVSSLDNEGENSEDSYFFRKFLYLNTGKENESEVPHKKNQQGNFTLLNHSDL
jgi:hypothetical protein